MHRTEPIVTNEKGDETHPAFGMAHINRVSSTPGAVLFDSELRHQHYISLTVSRATRKRDLKRDWIHGGRDIIKIAMSEAQWAQLVTSTNSEGTPVTLIRTETDDFVPDLPYEPRMAVQLDEVRKATEEVLVHIRTALDAYEAHPTKAGLRSLRAALENASRNTVYTAKALSEHVENTVTRARADIEAMVSFAAQHNVAITGVGGLLELDSGNEGDTP